jgi:hypothetical protein
MRPPLYRKMDGSRLLLNFLPMILLYFIVVYSPQMAKWSHSLLGKSVAIAIILIYSFFDIISGFLACALIIFYYQSDYVESFQYSLKETDIVIVEKEKDKSEEEKSDLESLDDAYPLDPTVPVIYDKDVQQFRQKHCSKGHLIHKGQIVKPEMAEHVFPEIKQDSFHKCNICDPECSFNLDLIHVEDELLNPRSSNDWFEQVWTNMKLSQHS